MSFESSLTTVALLSAYTENTNNHYLDLLVPFVEYCIPSSEGEILDYKNISLQLGTEFGIVDMPEKIVAAIVKAIPRPLQSKVAQPMLYAKSQAMQTLISVDVPFSSR